MIFKSMLPGQRLILIHTKTKQPPTKSLVAKSVKPSIFKRVHNSINCVGASLGAVIGRDIKPKLTVLCFLAGVLGNVILEDIANAYIQKMVGV